MEGSARALERLRTAGGPVLETDWRDVVFFNFAVPPQVLQPMIPCPLDLHDGNAYVSVVLFDQQRFRTAFFRRALSPLVRPLGSHLFCNMRTYVRCGGDPGICFLREWVPNPLGAAVAPRSYGLPYRLAEVRYEHDRVSGTFFGRVTRREATLVLHARIEYDAPLTLPEPGSVDDFVMERYAAFQGRGRLRTFRIWHVPWPQRRAQGEILEAGLLHATGDWYASARLVTVNYSPGIDGVQIGLPSRISG